MRTIATLTAAALLAGGAAAESDPKVEYFEKKVRPILVGHCAACHSAETKPAGGLRVDDRRGLTDGGNSGPAVVPGQPEKSLLLQRVSQTSGRKRQMPLEGEHLTSEQVATLSTWIRDGAAWPPVKLPRSLGQQRPEYEELRLKHWAWQPRTTPSVPPPADAAWPADDVDRFVRAKLDTAGLTPDRDADRPTLIRRLTFDLTGVPPTPAEIDAFVADTAADALPRLVDRLLASPAFGEHWGRHWLDVVRYGESTGPSRNVPYPHAWKYRDYVIDSVNADVPFDRFLREQIAGDLLPASPGPERDRLMTATGFLALGVKDVNQRFKERFQLDNVDEQIDVVSRAVLGLTVSCARCHDHKFDPIPTTDYYALAGIFASTDNAAGVRNKMGGGGLDYYDPTMLVRLSSDSYVPPADKVEALTAQVAEAKEAWDAIRGTPEGLKRAANGQPTQRPFRLKYERLQRELLELADPAAHGFAVHGVRDAKRVGDTELRVRGEAERRGPLVPRGYLTAFAVPGAPPINPAESGRRELAEWLVSPANPLTARVAVNRVWANLFGRGLVATVDNFGVTGDAPSHPELLDHLADRFVRDGWSVKRLVRTLALTRTYRLAADATGNAIAADPVNRLLWRHAPRRLSAEELRDAVLQAAGTLVTTRPSAPAPDKTLKMVELRDNGPEARAVQTHAEVSVHRSVYLPALRGLTPPALEAFDPVDQTLVSGRRDTTTGPAQALFLLNSTFVRKQALALAARLTDEDDAGRVRTAYRLTLGRLPSDAEVRRATAFVAEYAAAYVPPAVAPPPAPKGADKPKDEPANPDEADQTPAPVVNEAVGTPDARKAAWAALAQALIGSAEFRYIP